MQKKWIFIALGVLVVGAVAYYGISPIFMHTVIDDTVPGQGDANTILSTGAEVVGTVGHPAEGIARIVRTDGKIYLRYENFKTLNGPDLFVYLASNKDATEFVNLGRLKATEGNVNYEISEGTDLSKYPYALVWCRAFGVLFNSADLSAI